MKCRICGTLLMAPGPDICRNCLHPSFGSVFREAMDAFQQVHLTRILNDPHRAGDGILARRAEKFIKKGGA